MIKLTVHMFGRTEVTTHADAREARSRIVAICSAQTCRLEGNGDAGTFVPQVTVAGRQVDSPSCDSIGSYEVVEVADDAHLYWVIETADGERAFTGTEAEVRAQAREFYVGSTIRKVTKEKQARVIAGR